MNKEPLKISELEQTFLDQGKSIIIGVDECGCGALVHSVVAAAVALDYANLPSNIKDSKYFSSEAKREESCKEILSKAVSYNIFELSAQELNDINDMDAAGYYIRYKAVEGLMWKLFSIRKVPNVILVDRFDLKEVAFDTQPGSTYQISNNPDTLTTLTPGLTHMGIVDGDSTVACIAAASIVGKSHRDQLMLKLDKEYPEYNFKSNKGYGTADHIEGIKKYGITQYHRKHFGPCQDAFLREIKKQEVTNKEEVTKQAQASFVRAYNLLHKSGN